MTTLNTEQFVNILNSSNEDNLGTPWPSNAKDALRFLWNEMTVLKIALATANIKIEELTNNQQIQHSQPRMKKNIKKWDDKPPVVKWVCQVPSATEPGVYHTVTTPSTVDGFPDESKRTCTCKGFHHNGRCKHLNQVGNSSSGEMCPNIKVFVWRNIDFTEDKWNHFTENGWDDTWGEFPYEDNDQDVDVDVDVDVEVEEDDDYEDDDEDDDYEDDDEDDDYEDEDEDDDDDDDCDSIDSFIGDIGWVKRDGESWTKVNIVSYDGDELYTLENSEDEKDRWTCNIGAFEQAGKWKWIEPYSKKYDKHEIIKILTTPHHKDSILYNISKQMDQSSFIEVMDFLKLCIDN